jgi:hypothetical protein
MTQRVHWLEDAIVDVIGMDLHPLVRREIYEASQRLEWEATEDESAGWVNRHHKSRWQRVTDGSNWSDVEDSNPSEENTPSYSCILVHRQPELKEKLHGASLVVTRVYSNEKLAEALPLVWRDLMLRDRDAAITQPQSLEDLDTLPLPTPGPMSGIVILPTEEIEPWKGVEEFRLPGEFLTIEQKKKLKQAMRLAVEVAVGALFTGLFGGDS